MDLLQLFGDRCGKVLLDFHVCLLRQRHRKTAKQELCDGHLVLALLSNESKAGMCTYHVSLFVQKFFANKKSMHLYCPAWLPSSCTLLSNIYYLVFGFGEWWLYIAFRNWRISFQHVFQVLSAKVLCTTRNKNAAYLWIDRP